MHGYVIVLHVVKRLDFWSEPSKVGAAVDIRVSPEQKLWLTQRAKEASLAYEVIIDDVQVYVSLSRPLFFFFSCPRTVQTSRIPNRCDFKEPHPRTRHKRKSYVT